MRADGWRSKPVVRASLRASASAVVAAAFLLLLTSSVAFAFTVQPGFSATTYASGYVSGAPAGVAFIGTTMYTADPGDGFLYANPAAGTAARVGSMGGAPTGLAAFGGSLFAIRSTPNDVARVDPATGAVGPILATSASVGGLRLNGIAADPVNGDLYLAADQGYLWVIRAPYSAPPAFLLQLTGAPATFGIAVAADHSLYVATEGLGSSGIRQITPSLAQGPVGPDYVGARGVGVIPGYIFVSNADGSMLKIVMPGVGSGIDATALLGGATGGAASIGADGCFYASQGPAVVRLADLNGTCRLDVAGPPPPPPAITLARTSTTLPLIGNGDQTFTAVIANASPLSGITVTFSVTRGTAVTTYVRQTDANGAATFGYTPPTPGTDVVSASAVVNATTITSAPISLTWPRALDTVAPIITYTVAGAHNANPAPPAAPVFACPNPALGTPGSEEYCGWYTSPPTIHWTVARGIGGTTDPVYTCPDYTLSASSPISGTPVTCTAQNADGKSTALKVVLQAVLSPPTINVSATTTAGAYTGVVPTKQDVTVTFTCATDPNLGPAGISFCGPTQTVTAEGPHTVSGFVLDVAGTRRDAAFGPFTIDKTPPAVTVANMRTADGVPYVSGTPTIQDVLVTFSCTDAVGMAPTGCPGETRVTAGPSVTVSATDLAGNIGTYTFGGINIDRTGPVVTSTITPAPDANGNNSFTATVALTATDPSGVASITYEAKGQQLIAPVTVSGASAQVALNVIGTTEVFYYATDTLGNVSATGTVTVHIVSRQASTLRIVSQPAQIAGASAIQVALTGPAGVPVVGRSVTITGAGTTETAITGANGTARLGAPLAPGSYTIGATFSGDAQWYPATATTQTLVVAGATQFVIWGGNAPGVQAGQRVVFWGEHWWDGVHLPQKLKVQDFKGWAATVGTTTWSTKPGDSKPPRSVPTYISVVITTSIHRVRGDGGDDEDGGRSGGDRITGNVVGHAILRVDPGYKDEPGRAVTGVVVAILP